MVVAGRILAKGYPYLADYPAGASGYLYTWPNLATPQTSFNSLNKVDDHLAVSCAMRFGYDIGAPAAILWQSGAQVRCSRPQLLQ